jgi:hypothetical protein
MRIHVQALGQQPLTFNRSVMALAMAPHLLNIPAIVSSLPSDVIQVRRSEAELHEFHVNAT